MDRRGHVQESLNFAMDDPPNYHITYCFQDGGINRIVQVQILASPIRQKFDHRDKK
jgi:hypothetical protein|tara:strand:+ start:487 stop:654 length:168 start_codon:yes stop_codon:yes gene_type:complete